MAEIEEKVKAIIIDKLGVEESQVTPEANFQTDLGADSLDTVEMIMEFEKEFGIYIPDVAIASPIADLPIIERSTFSMLLPPRRSAPVAYQLPGTFQTMSSTVWSPVFE